MRYNLV